MPDPPSDNDTSKNSTLPSTWSSAAKAPSTTYTYAPSPASTGEMQFHHYQPAPASASSATSAFAPTAAQKKVSTARHPITAPFQIPRIPHPWPHLGARPKKEREGKEEVPIDPQLLEGGGEKGGDSAGVVWQREDSGGGEEGK
ncbi:hypothetical protein BS50DRAFT_128257 [Corynespora cassiicola Philippines]|uniref:Uncharacterized protein n=1 Tax=Corynespora cassiicola Philippines TaxID=1448308 RepID=A0A2T2NBC4_CORCC|nr:hypothetical protein BS50DRAFT_128257 [Corynespora cassiicola Philippines]